MTLGSLSRAVSVEPRCRRCSQQASLIDARCDWRQSLYSVLRQVLAGHTQSAFVIDIDLGHASLGGMDIVISPDLVAALVSNPMPEPRSSRLAGLTEDLTDLLRSTGQPVDQTTLQDRLGEKQVEGLVDVD